MSVDSFEQPKSERAYTPEASELIACFQKAKQAQTREEQDVFFRQFYMQLVKIVVPEEEHLLPIEDPEYLRRIFVDENRSAEFVPVGSGTAGQRIYFLKEVTAIGDAELQRLGADTVIDTYNDTHELRSKDGAPQWMQYPEPTGRDKVFGERYWRRYLTAFGNSTVNLLQEIS